MDYEALAKEFGAQPVNDSLEELAKKYGAKPIPKKASALEVASAGAAGFNSGVLAGLPGLVVDTALNAANLVKAAYGAGGHALGLVKADDMPKLFNPTDFVGSSEWIRNKIADAGGGLFIKNPRPDDATARIANLAGLSAAGARTPGQLAAGAAGGISQALAEEAGLSTPWQIIASMGPQAVNAGVRGGTRAALGGNEEQRAKMRENINTLKEAGVDNPSAGLVGTRTAAALEALASRYPGASGVIAANAKAVQAGLSNRVRELADATSPNRGDAATGSAMQQDITGRWKDKFDRIYSGLDDKVQQKVGDARVPIDNTLAASGLLSSGVAGAPNVSQVLLGGSGIPRLDAALRADASIPANAIREAIPALEARLANAKASYSKLVQESGIAQAFANDALARGNNWTPVPGMPRVSSRASNFPERVAEGSMAASDISAMLPERRAQIAQAAAEVQQAQAALDAARPSLPYPALRATGSMIGKEAGDKLLHGSSESGRYKQLYGAIAEDKANAANQAGAQRDLERGNRLYSAGVSKMDALLSPITKDGISPEQAYNQFRSMVFSSPSKAAAIRSSLSQDVRKMQTASLIDELGQATPGRQNAEGSQFSSETFLTNWNKVAPSAKTVIFSGFQGAGELRSSMESIAKAAELIRTKGGVYANPSGTAGAAAQIGVGGGLVLGAVNQNYPLIAGILGSVAGANISARLMTNPKFVNWLAKSGSVISPETANNHIKRLAIVANDLDEESKADLQKFADSLANQ